ncbi:hypothetical protein [Kitasatospora sp. NPDC088351]|uniref:hypothetical protein n=1 Tax=Kitasatospora sp. NPDC088351 TaxID=3155180 RepID=UPI0034129E54
MDNTALWTAVTQQADVWKSLVLVQEFASRLPRNSAVANSGVPGRLQLMQASGAEIAGTPLRLTHIVNMFSQLPSGFDDVSYDEAQWQNWHRLAGAVEAAHRHTIAWLRSRMPGYPQLPAPQLTPGTVLTTTEFTYRLAWQPDELAAGLQRQDVPRVGQQLQAGPAQIRALAETARALAAALQASREWQRLETARSRLDADARAALLQARARLKERLAPAALDAHEPSRVMARHNYRTVVQDEEIDALTGPARDFADAFEHANTLVETAASDVFGQLAIYGAPSALGTVTGIDLEPGTPRIAHFTYDGDLWPHPGQLVQIDDALVKETCRLSGTSFSITQGSQASSRLSAEILPGTAAFWRTASRG